MWFWWWIIGAAVVLLGLLIAVLCSRIHIDVEFVKHDQDDRLHIKIRALYGVIRFRYDVPSVLMLGVKKGLLFRVDRNGNLHMHESTISKKSIDKDEIKQWYDQYKELLIGTQSLRRWAMSMIAHFHVNKLDWSTNIGMADCAHTATSTGVLWAIKSALVGWLSTLLQFHHAPSLFVVPLWKGGYRLSMRFHMQLHVSSGSLLKAMLLLLWRISRTPGGLRVWRKVMSAGKERRKRPEPTI